MLILVGQGGTPAPVPLAVSPINLLQLPCMYVYIRAYSSSTIRGELTLLRMHVCMSNSDG